MASQQPSTSQPPSNMESQTSKSPAIFDPRKRLLESQHNENIKKLMTNTESTLNTADFPTIALLLIIIAAATTANALPVPVTLQGHRDSYVTPVKSNLYMEPAVQFVPVTGFANSEGSAIADYAVPEDTQALYEDDWAPEQDGGAPKGSAAGDDVLVAAESGAFGFHMRQAAWRRGVRAYDPHHWNRLPQASPRKPRMRAQALGMAEEVPETTPATLATMNFMDGDS